jgi:diamine N-acetyltransferase
MDPVQQPPRPPILNITGAKVALGPYRRDLLPLYLKWMNDFAVTRTLGNAPRPMPLEAEEAWYEQVTRDERTVGFTIYERTTWRPIGTTALAHVDHRQRTAEFGIVIGEKDAWGKGYGTEATVLLLDYGFTALGLHNILLQVYSDHERAIRAYTRAGFRVIGRRREAHRRGGRVYDIIAMDCLASEFHSPVLYQVLVQPPSGDPKAHADPQVEPRVPLD